MPVRPLICFGAVSTLLCCQLLRATETPAFRGPTPGTFREISIPTVDISADTHRQAVIARGTEKVYHGHCDTVLLPDGKTMFTAWTVNHARTIGPLARSDDSGLTWSAPLDVPANWHTTANTPAIHRLVDPHGKARLVVFADGLDWRRKGEPPYPMHQAVSEDDGKTWTPMKPNGIQGEVPPKTVLSFDGGRRLILWSDLPEFVVQSESCDGGLTWSKEHRILKIPARWGQPAVTRSADGKTLVMLLRENSRKHHSLYSISTDDAQTWSAPQELPAALTGDRHVIKTMPDGRLVIAFRDMATTSAHYGHYLAWVGTLDDIVNRREGQYRIKLLHNANRTPTDQPGTGNTDCGYSDLELLGDGTLIATTYIKYAIGPEKSSVVSTRFKLSETDALAKKATASTGGLLPANRDRALAGDIVTFEVIGHFNEPQGEQRSESAIHKLPDGAWMAVCRNDKGNDHFTTSAGGKTWRVGKPLPHVPGGANSKPACDRFGGIDYLGWQGAPRVQNAGRSIFNVDISRDAKTWQCKYRFETPESFQYPAFHEHESLSRSMRCRSCSPS